MAHDFYQSPAASNGEKRAGKHPTQKPVQLMGHFISLLSCEGDMVMDPFMGSGSTAVAAQNLGRNFIGIELNEKYFEIARERTGISQLRIEVECASAAET